jgi:ComF family protein
MAPALPQSADARFEAAASVLEAPGLAPALPQSGTSREGGHSDPHLFISGGPEMAPALPQSADIRSGATSRLCGECRLSPPAFAYARAAARYEEVAREALHAFKFGGRRAMAGPLGDLLMEVAARGLPQGLPDLLVPVPLHPRRQRERGFNQASLLAHRLGRGLGRPVRDDVLARAVATQSQTALDASARKANVRGAFRLRRPEQVAGRHVLVVDDILTTGATLTECVHRLAEAGAGPIGVITVARVA